LPRDPAKPVCSRAGAPDIKVRVISLRPSWPGRKATLKRVANRRISHETTVAHSVPLPFFAAQETIFDRVKKRLGSTALFGCYHPYGRLMHGVDLGRDYPRYNFSTSDSLCQALLMQWAEVWDIRFLPFRDTLLAQNHSP
jgi:hypothetical protein